MLRVTVVDRATRARLPLLLRSAVGTSVSGKLRTVIYNRARGRVPIRLRVPTRELTPARGYAIEVDATTGGGIARLAIPFSG
jgi:hypothetical protein